MFFHLEKLLVYHPYDILFLWLFSELIFFFWGGGGGFYSGNPDGKKKKKKNVFINILYYVSEKATHFFELLHEILWL